MNSKKKNKIKFKKNSLIGKIVLVAVLLVAVLYILRYAAYFKRATSDEMAVIIQNESNVELSNSVYIDENGIIYLSEADVQRYLNQDLYYNIYNSNLWFGDLKEIIIGFDISLDSRFVVPRFAEKRIRCGRECLKGGNCQICFRIDELSKSLEKAGLMIKIDKDNKTDNKEEIDINDVMKNIFENDKKYL